MSAYQFVNLAPVLFNIPGTQSAAGGNLYFYDEGTTNQRDTWSDPALTILNSNPVALDASGRSNTAIWLDGNYTVVLRDSLGDMVWTRISRSDAAAGTGIPALVNGYFLTNDGSVLLWQPVLQVPDPTGSATKVLGTDGTNLIWQTASGAGTSGVVTHQIVTAAATTNIDLTLGLSVTLNQAVSITTLNLNNPPGGSFVLSIRRVKDASATPRTIVWPASVKWPGGAAPTLTSTSGAIDEIALKYAESIYTGTFRTAFS